MNLKMEQGPYKIPTFLASCMKNENYNFHLIFIGTKKVSTIREKIMNDPPKRQERGLLISTVEEPKTQMPSNENIL